MRIWKGKLMLRGAVTRGPDARPGDEVNVRVIVTGDNPPDIDVETSVDPLGVPRYRVATAEEFDPRSVFRALAMTQPNTP